MSVVIETTLGDVTVDLFLKERPRACQNFIKLCKLKYYNFNLFHTISRGFIAQTGDPTGSRTGGESVFGILEGPLKRFFEAEKYPIIKHTVSGLISYVGNEDRMIGSQFFFTLGDELTYLDEMHCVFGEVTEGQDVLEAMNEAICDTDERPYKDIRITHTVVLYDPLPDLDRLQARIPSRSPSPSAERLQGGRIAPDEDIDDTAGKSLKEVSEIVAEREAQARATILEMIGDIPDAEIAPPENVLFVCKLNPVTNDDDLEIIFSRFGKIKTCEVIRDRKSGDSLQYAFVEFEDQKSCEEAYFKMDNVLIDDRRIHVDFSQSVSKIKWLGKGRGVAHFDSKGRVKKDVKNEKRDGRKERRRSRSSSVSSSEDKKQNNKSEKKNRGDYSSKTEDTSRSKNKIDSSRHQRKSPNGRNESGQRKVEDNRSRRSEERGLRKNDESFRQRRNEDFRSEKNENLRQRRNENFRQGRNDDLRQGRNDDFRHGRNEDFRQGRSEDFRQRRNEDFRQRRNEDNREWNEGFRQGRYDDFRQRRNEDRQGRNESFRQGRYEGSRPRNEDRNVEDTRNRHAGESSRRDGRKNAYSEERRKEDTVKNRDSRGEFKSDEKHRSESGKSARKGSRDINQGKSNRKTGSKKKGDSDSDSEGSVDIKKKSKGRKEDTRIEKRKNLEKEENRNKNKKKNKKYKSESDSDSSSSSSEEERDKKKKGKKNKKQRKETSDSDSDDSSSEDCKKKKKKSKKRQRSSSSSDS